MSGGKAPEVEMSMQRVQLLNKVSREENIAIKVDAIAELTGNIDATLAVMSRESQEKYDQLSDEIRKMREFFIIELERLSGVQDAMSSKIDGMATREEITRHQDETRANFAALRKQISLLLGQQQPK